MPVCGGERFAGPVDGREDVRRSCSQKTDFDFYPKEFAETYYQDEQTVIRSEQAVVQPRRGMRGRSREYELAADHQGAFVRPDGRSDRASPASAATSPHLQEGGSGNAARRGKPRKRPAAPRASFWPT